MAKSTVIQKTAYLDAEHSVIGAILLEPNESIGKCLSNDLTYQDFHMGNCKIAYKGALELFKEGKPVDIITLIDYMQRCGFDESEAKVFLVRCAENIPTTTNLESYIKVVISKSQKTRVYRLAEELQRKIKDNAPEDAIKAISDDISKILNKTNTDRQLTAKEGIINYFSQQSKPKEYIKTGLISLDKIVQLRKGNYVVIGARPSVGKTALTLQFMLEMAKERNVVYFSMETSGMTLIERAIANYFDMDLYKVKNNNAEGYSKISKTADLFKNLKFTIVDAAGWTVSQIKSKSLELQAEVIFIDYLGLVRSPESSRYESITNISIDLHIMAQQTEILTFVISQLRRIDGKPSMEDLRESGQIEQDADVILMPHTVDEDDVQIKDLVIAKNKEGMTGTIGLFFDGSKQRFTVLER